MKITIETESNKYDAIFGSFEEKFTSEYIPKNAEKCLVVTDETVFSLYEDRIDSFFGAQSYNTLCCILEPGEKNKNAGALAKIVDALCENEFTRDDFVVALGGGVISDLAGFAAAIYRRGIGYFTIPTTLLSMVDASVGGKTGIDTRYGKNSIGVFWQPSAVFIDTSFLATLPEKEYANGMAEVIKCAIITGEKTDADIEDLIAQSVALKADVVARDEHDTGIRHILNLGHTLGHALETVTDYELSHGEAVSIGLSVMCDKYDNILEKYGLPTKKWLKENREILDQALNFIKEDKKCTGDGKIEAVFVKNIGDCFIRKVTVDEFRSFVIGNI